MIAAFSMILSRRLSVSFLCSLLFLTFSFPHTSTFPHHTTLPLFQGPYRCPYLPLLSAIFFSFLGSKSDVAICSWRPALRGEQASRRGSSSLRCQPSSRQARAWRSCRGCWAKRHAAQRECQSASCCSATGRQAQGPSTPTARCAGRRSQACRGAPASCRQATFLGGCSCQACCTAASHIQA